MQLTTTFSALLVSLLAATTLVEAAPAPRGAGMVSLPLRAVERRTDVHPRLHFQQHVNRAVKRHAEMTGRQVPTELEMRDALVRRAMAIEAEGADSGLAKRFFSTEWSKGKFAKIHADAAATKKAGNTLAAVAPKKVIKTTKTTKAKPAKKPVAAKVAAKQPATNVDATGTGTKHHAIVNDDDANDAAAAIGVGNKKKGGKKTKGKAAAGGAAAAAPAAAAPTADVAGPGFSQDSLNALLAGGLNKANDPNADNSIGLDIEANDIGYIATVQMGTPPRDFKLLMDSGSADLWVGGENCLAQDGSGGCGNHTFLGTQSSSSFVDSGKPFTVTYGSGEVNGTIITDNLNVAGLALNAHTFGVATGESVDFSADTTPFDGLMGLAVSTLSQQAVPTPPESLAAAGLIQDAIVSYKISRLADNKNDGTITFGGLDNKLFDPNTLVTFDNVNKDGFWEGDFTISVDGTDIGLQGRTAILDTGTSLIIAPAADATAFHDAIPGSKPDGQGGFTIPCTTSASVAFTFAGTAFAIDPRDLLFTPVDNNDLTGDCVSAVSSGNIGGDTEWLVGDVFLKNAYFSHDVTKNQISLAKLV